MAKPGNRRRPMNKILDSGRPDRRLTDSDREIIGNKVIPGKDGVLRTRQYIDYVRQKLGGTAPPVDMPSGRVLPAPKLTEETLRRGRAEGKREADRETFIQEVEKKKTKWEERERNSGNGRGRR
jgi:hypothetical protein